MDQLNTGVETSGEHASSSEPANSVASPPAEPEIHIEVKASSHAAAANAEELRGDVIVSTATRAMFSPLAEGPGTRIGPYKILQQIGEGGFGVVFMAEQERPVRRRVALKIIKLGMDTRQVIARFEAERQALAMMDHPNIARVLDAGATETGRPYFVMELVRGVPITQYCDGDHLTASERLDLFIQVCRAVQHAHQKGIIHRDIKPSNILVTLHDGKPIPKVIDFGIAKATDHHLTEKTLFTEYRAIVGTPAYMSPEQAEMSGLDIDTRTDVYSLGVLLYELLTGTTPMDADELRQAGYAEMQRIIRDVEPPRPSTRVSTMGEALTSVAANRKIEPRRLGLLLRGDLDWIVMKALEKDRGRRYTTADAFAADVSRYLNGEPVVAAPPSASYRVRKFVRRHRGAVMAGAAMLLMLLGAVVVSSMFAVLANRSEKLARESEDAALAAQRNEREQRLLAESARLSEKELRIKADRSAYTANVSMAKAALNGHQLAVAQQRLQQCAEPERNYEWRYLNANAECAKFMLPGIGAMLSRDGARLATQRNGAIYIWDTASAREVCTLSPTDYPYGGLSLSRDGRRLARNVDFYTAGIFDATDSGKILCSLVGHKGNIVSIAFNHDGSRVATAGGSDKTARIWDASTGKLIWTLAKHTNNVPFCDFSEDGQQIITTSADCTAYIWDAQTGREICRLVGHTASVGSAKFSPDGLKALTLAEDKSARLWNAATGSVLRTFSTLDGNVISASFNPDGQSIVTAHASGMAYVWDAGSGQQVCRLVGHRGAANSASFSPDGSKIITASADRTARTWDARSGQPLGVFAGVNWETPKSAVFSCDGRTSIISTDKATYISDVSQSIGERIIVSGLRLKSESRVSFIGDGESILCQFPDGYLRTIPLESQSAPTLLLPKSTLGSTQLSPDRNRILVKAVPWSPTSKSGHWVFDEIWLFDAATSKPIARLEERAPDYAVSAFNVDGSLIATPSESGEIHIWNASDGSLKKALGPTPGQYDISQVNFSPDARYLFAANSGGVGGVWDLSSGEQFVRTEAPSSNVYGFVTFSPDTKRLFASTSSMASAAVIDLTLPERPRHLLVMDSVNAVWNATFNKDATRLVVHASGIHLLDATTGFEVHSGNACSGLTYAQSVSFSPDGQVIAAVLGTGVVAIYDVQTGVEYRSVQVQGKQLGFLCFSADSKLVATSTPDGDVYVWTTRTDPERPGPVADWLKVGPTHLADAGAFDADKKKLVALWGTGGAVLDVPTKTSVRLPHALTSDLVPEFSHDGQRVLGRGGGVIAAVWDSNSGAIVPDLGSESADGDHVSSLQFNEALTKAIVQTVQGSAYVVDVTTGKRLRELWRDVTIKPVAAMNADCSMLVAATSRMGSAQVFDARNGYELQLLAGHHGGIGCVGMNADGSRAVTGSDDTTAKVWDVASGNVMATLTGHERPISAVAISPDGLNVVTADLDGAVRLYAANAPSHPILLCPRGEPIHTTAFSSDGLRIIALGESSVHLWDAANGDEIGLLKHGAKVNAAVFSPDGRLIVTASDDHSAILWNAGDATLRQRLSSDSPVRLAVFNSDSTLLFLATADATAQIINVASGELVSTMEGINVPIMFAAFMPDSTRIVLGLRDRTIRMWNVAHGTEMVTLFGPANGQFLQAWTTPHGRYVVSLHELGVVYFDAEPERGPSLK